ncbi:hypothetical protein, partial [Klebsiella pneumoniae]|uniref:hypothetical protein n=1 Tax=Klebsiella pneumoniae TaxID=573 RepID=UPI00273030AD
TRLSNNGERDESRKCRTRRLILAQRAWITASAVIVSRRRRTVQARPEDMEGGDESGFLKSTGCFDWTMTAGNPIMPLVEQCMESPGCT